MSNDTWSENPGTLEPYPLPATSFSKVPNGATGIAKKKIIISCGFNTNPHDKIVQIM